MNPRRAGDGDADFRVFPALDRHGPALGQRPAQKHLGAAHCLGLGRRLTQDPAEAAADHSQEGDSRGAKLLLLTATASTRLGGEPAGSGTPAPGRPRPTRLQMAAPKSGASVRQRPRAESCSMSSHQLQLAKFLEIIFHNFSEALLTTVFLFKKNSTEIGHQ